MAAPTRRVLYSEDDPDSRELVCLALAIEGVETVCPETPQDVLRTAQAETFDLYLLDSRTPGMSGLELCSRLREFDTHTPIVFYSAAAFPADIHRALAAGAQAYITKPKALDEVVHAIRSHILRSERSITMAVWIAPTRTG